MDKAPNASNPSDISEQALVERRKGFTIGRYVQYLADVDSTNAYAFKLAMKGAPHGTIVVADAQTKGRGRLNRTWESPPNCNIYTSLILRPAIEMAVAPQITLLAGVAVAEALDAYCPGQVTLKWPNDVQIREKGIRHPDGDAEHDLRDRLRHCRHRHQCEHVPCRYRYGCPGYGDFLERIGRDPFFETGCLSQAC